MASDWSVLLVEDNPADVFLVARAFEETLSSVQIYEARDAEEALALLDDEAPDLVLLDLSLPGVGGLDVLAQLKQTPGLRELPVVVLTSSPAEADRHASISLGADAFVTKPSTFEDLLDLVRDLASRYAHAA